MSASRRGHSGPESCRISPSLNTGNLLQEAEAEKQAAGEGRNVEHVALHVDEAVTEPPKASGRGQRKRKPAAK